MKATPFLALLLLVPAASLAGADGPVNPKASPEARALLEVLRSASGKYILSGQHNFPNTKARNTEFVKLTIGKTPVVYSQDLGFAEAGDKDSYLARPDIVGEAKKQYENGSIVTLCWHAVPPTAEEPVTFMPRPPASPDTPPKDLASVQGRLTDEQWRDLLTPGTKLHDRWLRQVDTIAGFLARLRDARVPVLWRPYHEMNGDWFWWGGRSGETSTAALYRQLFDRLVNHHKLDNLVWVWSVDRPGEHATSFESVYPGDAYVDVVSLDVYGSDFAQSYYDGLVAIAAGRPVVLGEVGTPPTLEVLDRQPLWAMYVVWAGMHGSSPRLLHEELASSPRVLHLEDPAFWDVIAPLRKAAGRPTDFAANVHLDRAGNRVDFSGQWRRDESRSDAQGAGGPPPSVLRVVQRRDEIAVRRTTPSEYEDDAVVEERTPLDGTPSRSEVRGTSRVTSARWSDDGGSLVIESTVTTSSGGPTVELKSTEEWKLLDGGRTLLVKQASSSPWGDRSGSLLFEKQ